MKDGNKMTFSTLFNTIYLVPVLMPRCYRKDALQRRVSSFEESHFAAFIEKCSHVTGNINSLEWMC